MHPYQPLAAGESEEKPPASASFGEGGHAECQPPRRAEAIKARRLPGILKEQAA